PEAVETRHATAIELQEPETKPTLLKGQPRQLAVKPAARPSERGVLAEHPPVQGEQGVQRPVQPVRIGAQAEPHGVAVTQSAFTRPSLMAEVGRASPQVVVEGAGQASDRVSLVAKDASLQLARPRFVSWQVLADED